MQAAEGALARLQLAGEMIPSLDWFIYGFVRKEALLSSEIEGIQATLEDVLSYEQTEQAGASSVQDIEEITHYVAAIHYALAQLYAERGLPISVRLLNECHRMLIQGVRGANRQPGELRRSQNWVGGSAPANAVFVPPPPDKLAALLGNLETYIHEADDLPALLRIAVAHVQFERVRTEGDWSGWFDFFLKGVEATAGDAADTARALHRLVSDDRRVLLSTSGITVSAMQLFELLPEHPVISMPLVTRLLATTKPTAGKAIELLEAAGVLSELGRRKRDRVFGYRRYLELLAR